ncbi:hypothetical protein [uncultured Psychroserpens sp.]|uniref:hypothetical protein n=1 Tax=uncultured Psychroserpens sp. TaxID=255436 RepID=UPI00262CF052|nr:hypothetical protein [uncultured Psychroserpens sp.]
MKKLLVLVILTLMFYSCVSTKFDCIDKRACREYEKRLDSLSGFLFFQKNLTSSTDKWFDGFFEKITGHNSEADISYNGIDPPTINDYSAWTSWYVRYHNRLRFDKKENQVYVKKSYLKYLEEDAKQVESRDILIFSNDGPVLIYLSDKVNGNVPNVDPNQHHIHSNLEDIKAVFNILDLHDTIMELYTYPLNQGDKGYIEFNSKATKTSKGVNLFIQMNMGFALHTDTYFVLIEDKAKAIKVLEDLAHQFRDNPKGFQKLIKELKL